ncbi:OmpA family protein [Chryseobacterium defluvii]|uniref:OmpA family protein n=1 Tax=Chryseobacterium defluvii TaxID=160396 RepID=A0A495SD36_9FLAO|nr:OmpA family protein [Chryseobacterium defluvii]RKS97766.1 OmpA family protein [Chryseobacterium defluvii]
MKLFLIFIIFLFYTRVDAQTLTSVYFEHNSYELNEASKKKLDSLSVLKTNLTFRIFGNCDPSGSEEYNKALSEYRANTVHKYLLGKAGNNIKLVSSVGLGEEKQINDNTTEELRGKNRRVDVFVEKKFAPGQKLTRRMLPSFFETKVSHMKVKDTFSLPDVNFIGNRHVWLPKAEKQIIQLFNMLKDNPALEIELQGHICCDYENFDGEDIDLGTFNLSWTRANAVKEFLEKQGIDPSRIKARGLGHLNPAVYPELTESDQVRNRRVELVLIKK